MKRLRSSHQQDQTLWTGKELRRLAEEGTMQGWRLDAYREFDQTIHDSHFPCFFAPVADRKNTLRFTFLDSDRIEDLEMFAGATSLYLDEVRTIEKKSVKEAAFQILTAFVRTPERMSLEEEQRLAWKLLARLHELDEEEWPQNIPMNPSDPRWSFCWGGVPLFINISASGHRQRRSRRLAGHLALVIQPRDAFDSIAGDTREGHRLREEIRNRVLAYDGLPASPLLGTYGKSESLEWVQYGLPEHNGPQSLSTCPFQRFVADLKSRRLSRIYEFFSDQRESA